MMTSRPQRVLYALALVFSVLLTLPMSAGTQTLYNTGQNLQPAFEGWERNPDGTFTMVFGYLNRNYVEEPYVPVGPNNFFEPGPADQGQPTHFYPRRQSFVFKVAVPADWGDKELVWTVIHNGRTDKAYGSLLPHWVIDQGVWKADRGSGISGRTGREYVPNQPPSINVVGDDTLRLTLPESVTLTVSASDPDGKPGPKPESQRRSPPPATGTLAVPNTLPTIGGLRSGAGSGTGGPADQNVVNVSTTFETGLGVTWVHYRGPGKVTFDPMAMPIRSDGKAVTTARFSEPGTYILRAYADDGIHTAPIDVTVIVAGAASQVRR